MSTYICDNKITVVVHLLEPDVLKMLNWFQVLFKYSGQGVSVPSIYKEGLALSVLVSWRGGLASVRAPCRGDSDFSTPVPWIGGLTLSVSSPHMDDLAHFVLVPCRVGLAPICPCSLQKFSGPCYPYSIVLLYTFNYL